MSCSDLNVEESSTASSSWLSAPQIAIQAASPMTQSPASDEESADQQREVSAACVDRTIPVEVQEPHPEHEDTELSGLEMSPYSDPNTIGTRPSVHMETQDSEREECSATLSHLEKRQDSDSKSTAVEHREPMESDEFGQEESMTRVSGLEMSHDSDREIEVSGRDRGDGQIPDEVKEEPVEGRLSADTSEQIFIGQQIEAKASADRRQPDETGFNEGLVITSGLDESERGAMPTDLMDFFSAGTTDRLQSPEKTALGKKNKNHARMIFHPFAGTPALGRSV